MAEKGTTKGKDTDKPTAKGKKAAGVAAAAGAAAGAAAAVAGVAAAGAGGLLTDDAPSGVSNLSAAADSPASAGGSSGGGSSGGSSSGSPGAARSAGQDSSGGQASSGQASGAVDVDTSTGSRGSSNDDASDPSLDAGFFDDGDRNFSTSARVSDDGVTISASPTAQIDTPVFNAQAGVTNDFSAGDRGVSATVGVGGDVDTPLIDAGGSRSATVEADETGVDVRTDQNAGFDSPVVDASGHVDTDGFVGDQGVGGRVGGGFDVGGPVGGVHVDDAVRGSVGRDGVDVGLDIDHSIDTPFVDASGSLTTDQFVGDRGIGGSVGVGGDITNPLGGVHAADGFRGRVGSDGVDVGVDLDQSIDTPLLDAGLKVDQDFVVTDSQTNVGLEGSAGLHSPIGGTTLAGGARVQFDDDSGAANIGGGVGFDLGPVHTQFGGAGGVAIGPDGGGANVSADLGIVHVGAGVQSGGGDAGVSFTVGGVDADDQTTVEVSDEVVEDVVEDAVGAVLGDDAGEAAGNVVDGVGDFFFGQDDN